MSDLTLDRAKRRTGILTAVLAIAMIIPMAFASALHPVFDGGINRCCLPIAAIFGPDQAVARFAIIGIDHMAS